MSFVGSRAAAPGVVQAVAEVGRHAHFPRRSGPMTAIPALSYHLGRAGSAIGCCLGEECRPTAPPPLSGGGGGRAWAP
jgi:hypothetical protein